MEFYPDPCKISPDMMKIIRFFLISIYCIHFYPITGETSTTPAHAHSDTLPAAGFAQLFNEITDTIARHFYDPGFIEHFVTFTAAGMRSFVKEAKR